MNISSLPADVRGSDLALAVALTAAVFGGSLLALLHARLEHSSDVPAIDPGGGMAIAVRPVADLPSGTAQQGARKTGRDNKRASVPSAWRRKVPRASTLTQPPDSPSPAALPDVQPEPAPEPEPTDAQAVPPAPTDEVPPEPPVDPEAPPPDPAAEPSPTEDVADPPAQDDAANVETPEDPPIEDGGEAQPDAESEQDGAQQDTEGQGQQDGEGQQDGAAEGQGGGDGTDPLLERAIAFYRARLVAWFSSRFRVTGSGLSSAQLAQYRVRVHIDVGEDLRIVDFRILSSDHPDFEAAARSMLEKLRGVKLPAPPENYPGAVQRQLTVTFTCAPDSCD